MFKYDNVSDVCNNKKQIEPIIHYSDFLAAKATQH